MRTQYASTPAPSIPILATTSGNTTIAIAGTKYIWIYCRNRSGVTDFSPVASIAIAADQSLLIPLASTIRKTASDIHEIGVVMSTTSSPSSGCVVATYPGFDIDGVTPTTLPTTITLSYDSHFQLNAVVANPAALPSSNRINGMRRYVTSTALFMEWSDRASGWILCNPQNFNPYVASTIDEGGANVDLSKITNYSAIITPDYDVSGDLSAPVKFWIVNDTNYVIPQGKRVRIACSTANNEVVSDDFKGLMKITFLGYANTLTGVLDTTGMSVGGQMDYQGDVITNLLLPKDLPAGSAYVLQVQMAFDMADVDNKAYQGEVVKIYPYLAPHYAEYDPAYDDIGDRIFPTGGKRRILPNGAGLDLLADSGSGSIAYYKWRNVGQTDVFGASSNTPNQKVLVTNNGTCFVANTVPDTAGLRAVISTVDSVGHPTAWTGSIALDGTKILSITVTHATAIRADYPDIIAGTTATLNAGKVRVYARIIGSSNIRVFDAPIIGVNPTETILVGASGSTIITSLPSIDAEVGLFTPTSFTRTFETNSSVFTSGNYEIAIAYLYEDTVTSISHDVALGCVIESGGTLTELQTLFRVIGQPVADLAALRAIALANIFSWQTRYAISVDAEYRFDPTSYDVDDSDLFIKPTATDISSPGRWLKIVSNDTPVFKVATISELKSLTASTTPKRINGGLYAVDDNGTTSPGWYLYKASSTTAESLPTVVSPTDTTGRYVAFAGSGNSGGVADITRTSTTSNTIGTGSKTFSFATTTNLGWLVGTRLRVAYDGSNYLEGAITSVSSTSATILSDYFVGSGTYTSWNIALTGDRGATGATGSTGATGPQGIQGEAGVNGVDVTRTSTTSNSIGTGSKIFTYTASSNLGWLVGSRLRAANDGSNYMEGVVTSVSSTSATITSDYFVGSGTYTSWNITLTGDRGSIGATGATGATGAAGSTGATGATGAIGQASFSNTTSNFTQPSVGSNVTINLGNSDWAVIGANIAVAGGGTYQVIAKPNSTSLTIQNLTTENNTSPTTVINSGALVSPAGIRGATGASGSVASTTGLTLTEVATDPTTATDEIKIFNKLGELLARNESDGTVVKLGNYQNTLFLQPISTPTTPSTARGLFADTADGLLKTRDISSGTVRTLASLNRVQAFTQTQYATPVINNSATGTVTLDGSASNVFILTLTGNLTLTMNNIQVGATYIIYLIEDATGGATITLNSIFKRITGDTTTFNTAANKVNMLTGVARSSSAITLAPISVEV